MYLADSLLSLFQFLLGGEGFLLGGEDNAVLFYVNYKDLSWFSRYLFSIDHKNEGLL